MARNRDIAGLLTGTPSGGYAERMSTRAQELGSLFGSGIAGMKTGDSRTPQQRLVGDIKNFKNLTPEKQRGLIGTLQANGQTGLAGTLVADLQRQTLATKATADAQAVAASLPSEYSQLADAIRREVKGALGKGIEILSKEPKAPTKVNKKIVNLVNTTTDKTMGTATEIDGQLFNSQGQLMSPEELEGFGVSVSYVKPPTPLVSTAADPRKKAEAERRAKLFTPLDTIAESTAVNAESAGKEKRNAQTALRAVYDNAKTGAISSVGFDLAQIGQDVFQNLGIEVPQGWSKLTNSKAQYQMISAQGLLPRIEEQGKGFTDPERQYFLKEVIPSYKQAWQFNELSSSLQLEGATLKIAEAGFANNRRAWHVSEDKTPSQAHAVVWDDYTTKLPYSKLKKNAKITVGDKEVTYDKYHTMSDDAKLWQYWSSGQEPTGFTLRQTNGTTKDYSFAELNNVFSGFSAREVLQQAEKTGNLVGATY
jgi:hypothetical protein